MAKKNKVSKRKAKRNKGGHLKVGMGFSTTRTTFDNGCGAYGKRLTRAEQLRKALAD